MTMSQMSSTTADATILLVEDNEDLRENATLVLSLEGYQVFSACDGQEAIELLTTGKCQPDLIVSDIAMPRMDGYAFFKAVREVPELRVIPFIFLTARGSARDIRFGKQLGADDYLPKPFNADDFLVAVENKLRRSKEMRDHAEGELDNARRTMVQLLSHELRTPLTYVTGGFSLLAEELEHASLPEDMQVSMGLIHNGTQRLNRLAEQMVLYAELISGHARLQFATMGINIDLPPLVAEIVSLAQREFKSRRVQFKTDFQLSESLEVLAVPQLLSNAIYEVLRNAASYSHEGTETKVSLTIDGDEAVIVVKDQGWGIPPENQKRIWEVMIQSEREKYEQQGAGMGLPIVRATMLMHSGSAALESEPGQGTTVTLRLPIYRGDAEPSGSK
jgi:two-component system, sensor histidine kinase and response regulator